MIPESYKLLYRDFLIDTGPMRYRVKDNVLEYQQHNGWWAQSAHNHIFKGHIYPCD
jgi:hypothetical protein